MADISELDKQIAELALKYLPIASEILKGAIAAPVKFVEAGDVDCGTSAGEKPRLEYLKEQIIKHKAVENPDDVFFNSFGSLVWQVEDHDDDTKGKRVIYLDGHTDTVAALRESWHAQAGAGVDPYLGLVDKEKVNEDFLRRELGNWIPPKSEWEHALIFGRGSADQLAGVITQIICTKILLELKSLGSLKGVIVRSYGTVSEEDNDGGSCMHYRKEEWPKLPSGDLLPDVVILTEATGAAGGFSSDSRLQGPLGIYRGQRGRMQLELVVTGKSSHGSMPWQGRNPLEMGSKIIAQAADQAVKGEGFKDDPFLSRGTRTASWCKVETPSFCAVPERLIVRFDRRLTVGETPEEAVESLKSLPAVQEARESGFGVEVRIPVYEKPTWTGYRLNNPEVYMGWCTPSDHPSVLAACDAYRSIVTPHIPEEEADKNRMSWHKEPRVDRWVFSTDGVGLPEKVENVKPAPPPSKLWIQDGDYTYPAMLGMGPGYEESAHKIGECIDVLSIRHSCALLAGFPAKYFARVGPLH